MRGVHVIQGKGPKYLAFLTALRFMKTMIWIRKKKSVGEKNSLYNKELNYKQLWCAPLQKEMQPGKKKKQKKKENHLTLNKQTMKHNATVEKYKANNVITR